LPDQPQKHCAPFSRLLSGAKAENKNIQLVRSSGTGLTGSFAFRRIKNNPRCPSGRPCVRSKFEAVEIPLNKTKKSQNALSGPFLSSVAMANHLVHQTPHFFE